MTTPGQSADPNYRYSINEFPGDGTTLTWELNFAGGYISPDHIQAYTVDSAGNRTPTTFVLSGPNTILVSPAVPVGSTLVMRRITPKDTPLADFTDGAVISETNLDTNARQAVFIAAEAADIGQDAAAAVADRAIVVPYGEVGPTLPARDGLKGKLLGGGGEFVA